MNIVVVSGRLSSQPVVRDLQSGSVLVSFELTTRVDDVAVSVPLVWFDPPLAVSTAAGDEIAVLGTVRRRFYRAGGVTQSRTEVVVAQLARLDDKRAMTRLGRAISGVLGPDVLQGLRSE